MFGFFYLFIYLKMFFSNLIVIKIFKNLHTLRHDIQTNADIKNFISINLVRYFLRGCENQTKNRHRINSNWLLIA